MEVPEAFKEKMKKLMGEDYQALIKSYQAEPAKGIKMNTLKSSRKDLDLPFATWPVPWCKEGFYIEAEVRPGKNPFYYAGLYYVQEPTAMAAVQALDVQPGDWVLDLCAAPGGKAIQIAMALEGQGLLVANELVNSRASILSSNIERMGIANALVTNVFPEHLVANFYEKFDKILVDAPCSGEGMFRKDPGALADWSLERVDRCVGKQEKILETASKLLKPGGTLVYATCTFSPEENEVVIEAFLEDHPYDLERIDLPGLNDRGRVEWTKKAFGEIEKTLRIMPMHVRGEGHFIAKLKKTASQPLEKEKKTSGKVRLKKAKAADLGDYRAFSKDYLKQIDDGNLYLSDSHLYQLPGDLSLDMLEGLKILRPGLHLGTLKTKRFEPSYAWEKKKKKDQFQNTYDLADDDQAYLYLKGQVLSGAAKKGWNLMVYQGHPLGFSKASEGMLKNHYPKGLRIKKK